LVGKPEGKRPTGRPRHRWVDIRMDLGETGWGGVDWIGLALDRVKWTQLVTSQVALSSIQLVYSYLTVAGYDPM
jgi:hypothetical protein